MKHYRSRELDAQSLSVGIPGVERMAAAQPVLAQRAFPLNGLDRLAVQVAESHGRPVLNFSRQRGDDQRSVRSFSLSFDHAVKVYAAVGGVIRDCQREGIEVSAPSGISVQILEAGIMACDALLPKEVQPVFPRLVEAILSVTETARR